MADCRDREHRDEDKGDRKQRERADVSPQVAKRREERRRVEKRREDCDENDVRLKRDMRDARHEAERETAENEQDRIGNAEERREHEKPCARAEDGQQNERVICGKAHGPMLSGEHRARPPKSAAPMDDLRRPVR